MILSYRGTRSNAEVGGYCTGKRFAEFNYEDSDEERFFKIIDELKQIGWNVDTGVQNWACIEICDKDEFESLKEDWKQCKKRIK